MAQNAKGGATVLDRIHDDKLKIKVEFMKDEKTGQHYIGLPIDGITCNIPVVMKNKKGDDTPTIGAEMGANNCPPPHRHSGGSQQKSIEFNWTSLRTAFMDYDEVAEIYQNRQGNAGATTAKQYYVANMGMFTPMRDLQQIVWKFPFIAPEDLPSWSPLPDERSWPVYVAPPARTLYPSDFGRGTAIRMKKSRAGDVYLVVKNPLDTSQFTMENPKYYGKMWQVPCWMIIFRAMGVEAIDMSDNSITFNRRGLPEIIYTVNEIRSSTPGTALYAQRMQALVDIINDYPQQLRNLLNPGQIEASKAYLAQQANAGNASPSQQQTQQDTSSPSGTTYTPPPDLTPSIQQQIGSSLSPPDAATNPFAQNAYALLASSPQQGRYPMTANRPSGVIEH